MEKDLIVGAAVKKLTKFRRKIVFFVQALNSGAAHQCHDSSGSQAGVFFQSLAGEPSCS